MKIPCRHLLLSIVAILTLMMTGAGAEAASPPVQSPDQTETYTYPGPGRVNPHRIETLGGSLVVIDLQRGLAHAREALEPVQATGKPVRGIPYENPVVMRDIVSINVDGFFTEFANPCSCRSSEGKSDGQ